MNGLKEMALEAQLPHNFYTGEPMWMDRLEAFAKLVHQRGYIDGWSDSDEAKKTVSFEMIANAVEAEREACAKVCEDIERLSEGSDDAPAYRYYEAIRARSCN